MADHLAVAGSRREDVEAFGGGWRCRRAAGPFCRAQQEGRGADRAALSDHRDPGGRPRRLLDPPRAAGRGDRKPRRRSGVDCDLAPAAPGQDRRDRWRGAGARAAGLQAGRTAGVCDAPSADARGRRPPSSLARAQGLDERARATRQPHQGLLFSQGVSGYEPLRRDRRKRLEALRTGDGRRCPPI